MKVGDKNFVQQFPSEDNPARDVKIPGNKKFSTENINLGRLIKAKVLSVTKDGLAFFSVGGKEVSVKNGAALKVGQEVWLEITKGGEAPLVGLAGKKGAIVDLMRLMFSGGKSGEVTLKSSTISKLPDISSGENSKIPQRIDDFAKLFANTLHGKDADSLKVLRQLSLLGMFKASPKGGVLSDISMMLADPKVSESLLGASDGKDILRFAKLFDSITQLNVQARNLENNEYLLFPCFFEDDSGWGEWLFSYNDKNSEGEGKDSRYSLTFILEMSKLGDLQFQLSVQDNSLQGVFFVESKEVMKHMQDNLAELTDILKKIGYTNVSLSCQELKQGNPDLLINILTENLGCEKLPLLDVTI